MYWSLVMLFPSILMAQLNVTGTVKNSTTNEPLPGATVRIENSYKATATDLTGNFALQNLKQKEYAIIISYLGYETQEIAFNLTKDTTLSIALNETSFLQEEVVVSSTRAKKNSATTYTELDKEDIEKNNLGQDLPILLKNRF